MLNFSFNLLLLFLTFFLIKLNILLVNEETLILICFILFCSLSVSKLGPQVSSYFEDQLLTIHNTFTSSNKQFLESIAKNKKQLSPTVVWPHELVQVKKHIFEFNNLVLKNWPKVYTLQVQDKLFKKLVFSYRLEQQVIKLVSLVIMEKVKYNLTLHHFCMQKLLLKRSRSFEKIYLRECLAKLS